MSGRGSGLWREVLGSDRVMSDAETTASGSWCDIGIRAAIIAKSRRLVAHLSSPPLSSRPLYQDFPSPSRCFPPESGLVLERFLGGSGEKSFEEILLLCNMWAWTLLLRHSCAKTYLDDPVSDASDSRYQRLSKEATLGAVLTLARTILCFSFRTRRRRW